MSHSLISSADLTKVELTNLLNRADVLAQAGSGVLRDKKIALGLFNTGFPLPLDVQGTLRECGASTQIITTPKPENLSELAGAINAAGADAVLFSHPQTGAAKGVAGQVRAPLLNAGDGANENPVRALLDLAAIRALKGELEHIRIAILGNLKFGAEAHSLARYLSLFDLKLSLVTPAALSMPYDITDDLRANGVEIEETNDLATTLRKTDVLYLAQIDPQRVEQKIYDKQKNFYRLTPETFAEAKEGLVILGEWEGATALLAQTRPQVERAAGAMLPAILEYALN